MAEALCQSQSRAECANQSAQATANKNAPMKHVVATKLLIYPLGDPEP
jgi:hypothetical protein